MSGSRTGSGSVGFVLPESGEAHCTVCEVATSAPSLFGSTPVGTVSLIGVSAHHVDDGVQTSEAAEQPRCASASCGGGPADIGVNRYRVHQSWSV